VAPLTGVAEQSTAVTQIWQVPPLQQHRRRVTESPSQQPDPGENKNGGIYLEPPSRLPSR
jgi:hypothetical protein